MKNLVEAFTIFSKYTDKELIGAEHDELYVYVDPQLCSKEDVVRLKELNFHVDLAHFYMYV